MQTKHLATLATGLALAVAGTADSASACATIVSTDVVANTTWGGGANPSPICLQNPIFVRSGATLTILSGAIVRGQPRTAAVLAGSTVGTPGALIVTQSGRINADADPANPIIFTTAAIDNNNDGIADGRGVACVTCATPWGSGGDLFLDDDPRNAPLAPLDKGGRGNVSLWGGMVILGNAPTNLSDGCGVGKGKCTVEGLTIPGFDPAFATYGGIYPHDSSGTLDYVSVRHAGDELGNGNELNGISLGGVGDGTIFRNIEVYANFDDGIEWFGGTVNGSNLVVEFVGDDMFDLDQGYIGINEFLFGVMPFFNETSGAAYGSASGDKAGEWDGDDSLEVGGVSLDSVDGLCRPLSFPQMCNLTVIGSTPDAGAEFPPNAQCTAPGVPFAGCTGLGTGTLAASANRGIEMRHGFAGELIQSIVVNTGTALGFDIDSGSAEGCPGPNALCSAAGFPFACCTGVGTGTCEEFDALDNAVKCDLQVLTSTFDDGAAIAGDDLIPLTCGNGDVRTSAVGSDNTTAGFLNLVDEDPTFDPRGNVDGKLISGLKLDRIDPRPSGFTGIGGGPVAPCRVTYRGAFSGPLNTLWADNWTVLGIADMLE